MTSTGQIFPTAAVTAAESPWLDNDWTTPANVTADDGNTANVTAASYDSPDQTFVLKTYAFDFSAIPDGSTIVGVTCRVNAWYRSGQGSGSLDLLQLLDVSRAKVGTNQCATPVPLTTTNTTIITKGSASDLWGNVLTAAWVKDPDFGVAIGILATAANADVDVDYVTLEIEYTAPPGPQSVTSTAPGSITLTGNDFTITPGAVSITATAPGSVQIVGNDFTLTNPPPAQNVTSTGQGVIQLAGNDFSRRNPPLAHSLTSTAPGTIQLAGNDFSDRQSAVSGTSVEASVDLGGRRNIKKNSMKPEEDKSANAAKLEGAAGGQTIDGEVKEKSKA